MIFKNDKPEIQVPNSDLTSIVLAKVDELGDKAALIDGPTRRTLTYTQLRTQIHHLAAGLDQRGFKKGDVCAVFCPNIPEYATIFLGVAAVGGINTTINSLYSTNDLIHQFNDSGAKILITIPAFMDRALPAAQECNVEEIFVIGEAENATPFSELLNNPGIPPKVSIDPKNDLVALP
jgi:acyl-coenzyme A synthetase/AMP-(fatty) acid ligase